MIKSQALEANIASYHVDVDIDPRYAPISAVISKYYGLVDGLTVFLKELSHPYRNWRFIVDEARGYTLDYFHLFKDHPQGPEAALLFSEIFFDAFNATSDETVRFDAADILLLFLNKILSDSGSRIHRFYGVLNHCFSRMVEYEKDDFLFFVNSYYQISRLGARMLALVPETFEDFDAINSLCIRYFSETFDYWLREEDPLEWFMKAIEDEPRAEGISFETVFSEVTHQRIETYRSTLAKIVAEQSGDSRETLEKLVELPGFNEIMDVYRSIPSRLYETGKPIRRGNQWKIFFLFYIMNISRLSLIHEDVLREINRTLSWLIAHESHLNITVLMEKTFAILKTQTSKFPRTALNCVLNMGKGVYNTGSFDLVNQFIDHVVDLGFQTPMLGGVGNDWQIRVNSAHLQNIRTWMALIELKPKWSTKLISNLIIHLALFGIFIKDTDLFPRDITRFLNSRIEPVYNLAKQLTRLFPAFFNDIGAEGKLRDISTEIDEINHRKDVLIHFLRKQSHVESSNQILPFMEAVIHFWATRDKTVLEPFVPPSIYEQIQPEGPYIDGVHRILTHFIRRSIRIPEALITADERSLDRWMEGITGVDPQDRRRIHLLVLYYQLLHLKYKIGFTEIDRAVSQLRIEAFPELEKLKTALAETDLNKKVFLLLDYLELLKQIILSPEQFEVREDIYKKRHFTVDIPSMYGSYHEMKFDALGLTFRIEALVNVLFEDLIESIDLRLITKAAFDEIYDLLMLFHKAMKLDGISSIEMESQLDLLLQSIEIKGFTVTQYIDVFKGFARAVRNIINDYFHNIHGEQLTAVLSRFPLNEILPKYLPSDDYDEADKEKIRHRVSEIFFRDRIALSLGLQHLDLFIARILNTLYHQSEELPKDKIRQLLIYDPKKAITSMDDVESSVSGIIYLGNKGFNLVKLTNFGMPVPPGFIITTEVFRYKDIIYNYKPAWENFKTQLTRHITLLERKTKKKFGDPSNPLLISVRSGSSISQPGMMDTFLDVGMNEAIAAGLSAKTGNTWFAWDNYRRYLQCYGMSFDLKRDDFDNVIGEFKKKLGLALKKDFSGEQMREVALAYKRLIMDAGIDVEEDPYAQLYLALERVLQSWESSKAGTYRKIMGISDDWGTAVTVQEMVYGNLSKDSGSGVFFTHNPRWSEDSLRLWGDFTISNQGEDVVSGLVKTLPISIYQQETEMRSTDMTLESHFPEIFKTLKKWAADLVYGKGWSPQEMEFTFESNSVKDLYILQTRDMAMRERKNVMTFDPQSISEEKVLGHGVGVSGGAMSGKLVFSLDEIDRWRKEYPDLFLILVRNDTVPDDIREIFAADGLLTARGGLTSHAAVVAHRLGKTCVVGCAEMLCDERARTVHFGKTRLTSGDNISIDGRRGTIYRGHLPVVGDL